MSITHVSQLPEELLVYLGQFIDNPGPVARTCKLFNRTIVEGYYLFAFLSRQRRCDFTNYFQPRTPLNLASKAQIARSFLVNASRFVNAHGNSCALHLTSFHPKYLDQYVFLLMYNGVQLPPELINYSDHIPSNRLRVITN
jgi:hypothetical protein